MRAAQKTRDLLYCTERAPPCGLPSAENAAGRDSSFSSAPRLRGETLKRSDGDAAQDYNSDMRRNAITGLVALAIVVCPMLSFAANSAGLSKAQSCCAEMGATCAKGESPQSCCKTSLVQVEPSNLVRSVSLVADLDYSCIAMKPGTTQAIGSLAASTSRFESPPPRSSPPLVLRI
jgi:hypothetical protein